MDNITHTLIGAMLGEAGLKRRTGLGMPALMIGANIPDIDIYYALIGEGLSGRRGWTHGPVGLLVLPVLLASALLLFDRWQAGRNKRPVNRAPVRFDQLLLLAYVGALSHPLFDLMNNWGIRLLEPFSQRWFYGDALFIADPWIWLAAVIGIWSSRRRQRRGQKPTALPAAAALLTILVYCGTMAAAGRAAEASVADRYRSLGLVEPRRILASPVMIDPFARDIVIDTGDAYRFGSFRWLPSPRFDLDPIIVRTRMADPRLAQWVATNKEAADFLTWSRYPFVSIRRKNNETEVVLGDARYGKRPDAGLLHVRGMVPGSASRASAGEPSLPAGR